MLAGLGPWTLFRGNSGHRVAVRMDRGSADFPVGSVAERRILGLFAGAHGRLPRGFDFEHLWGQVRPPVATITPRLVV